MANAPQVFDLVVVGSGPGGYTAAIRAAQLGMNAAIIERERLGGVCLNWGCIPTKALLRSAEVYRHLQHAADFGLTVEGAVSFDTRKIVERSREIAAQLSRGVAHLMKRNKIKVINGQGALAGPPDNGSTSLKITTPNGSAAGVMARHVILATGARARSLAQLQADGELVLTYKEAMTLRQLPASLLIVGSGAMGTEFASFYRVLGVEVTLVEMMDRILPGEDEEISALAQKSFEQQGMKVLTSTEVMNLKKGAANVTVTVKDRGGHEKKIIADRVILALGVVGNVEDLGLEGTRVTIDRNHVVTDEYGCTGEPGIYAIGDLTGPPWLAHKASHEGVICVEKIAGLADVLPLHVSNIASCTYCTPQIASIGLTEAAARKDGYEVKVGRSSFIANGKAIALGEPDGLVKTIFDARTGELLGAHMIGAEVTELIQGFAIARTLEATEAELMHTVFPHPTLSELMRESVLDAFGRALNH